MMVEYEGNAHKKMINCLPRLFDMIYLIAQAAGCSVISKQELIYKIMTKDLGVVDRGTNLAFIFEIFLCQKFGMGS